TDGDDQADEIVAVLDGLPSDGQHQTDRLKFGPDGLLYIGQGSSTDAGEPSPGRPGERPLNAKILRLDLSSFTAESFASGLRNPFGMGFHPENGELFATDAGSGELCQFPPCDPAPPPFDELNWVVAGGSYGFPHCEGPPVASNPACAGVRPPLFAFQPHTTPTSIAFYTGPQAGPDKNQLLVTVYKRLFGQGGDLKRFVLTGSPQTGFQVTEVTPPIVDLQIIDPFDGPVDSAIDPISGDIYLMRLDPVAHRDLNEHHHIIYRIHRPGSDALPFIGPTQPATIQAGSDGVKITLIGRHLKPGAVVTADGTTLTTRQGATVFDLEADLPPGLTSSARTLQIAVRNPNGATSNVQQLVVFEEVKSPALSTLEVTKKGRTVPGARVGMPAKKMRLIANGRDFDSGALLLVDGSALELESSTATQLVGRFTAAMVAATGELTIQVRNSTGRVSNSLKLPVTE
ncbi:MAG TPA: PQQ-dependent sugar dehydrogenase, partial [Blastocatellia bacterium]|nr:PQQ-dependent sugar dehydrogenase [Blastocatellia bacterium]